MRTLFFIVCVCSLTPTFGQSPQRISHSVDNALGVYYTDVNRDGVNDIISYSPYGIFWSKNLGSGTFEKSTFLITYANNWTGLQAVADFDNDGDADFLVGHNDGSMGVYRCDGDFIYNFLPFDLGFENYSSLITEDVNNDGRMDLITKYDASLRICLNNGNFNFTITVLATSSDSYAYNCRLMDVNGDGDKDILVQKNTRFYVSENLGNGAFDALFQIALFAGGFVLDIDDYNQDGTLDLLCFHQQNDDLAPGPEPASLWYLWNDGSNVYTTSNVTTFMLPEGFYRGVQMLDWNNDQIKELVVTYENDDDLPADPSEYSYQFRYYGISSSQGLTLQKSVVSNIYQPFIYADINGDGIEDGIAYDVSGGIVGWLDYSDASTNVFHRVDQSMGSSNKVYLDDVNGDQKMDIVVFNYAEAGVGVYYQSEAGYGDVVPIIETAFRMNSFEFLDLDNDGDKDFIINSTHMVDDRGVYAINENGQFQIQWFTHPVEEQFVQYYGDLNNDGRCDYIYQNASSVHVKWSSSSAFFDGPLTSLDVISGSKIDVFDFNHDGWNDIITSGSGIAPRVYLASDAAGSDFDLHPELATNMGEYGIDQVIRFNDDNLPDLVSSNLMTSTIAVANATGYDASIPGPNVNNHFSWCDFNNDGLTDYYYRYNSNSWLLMRNIGGDFEAYGSIYGPEEMLHLQTMSPGTAPQFIDWRNRQLYVGQAQIIPDPLYVEGYVFWDQNGNGAYDMLEPLMDMPFEIEANGTSYFTSATGQFAYVGNGNPVTVTLPFDSTMWQLTTDSTSYTLSGDSSLWGGVIYFGLTPLNTQPDVEILQTTVDFACDQTDIHLHIMIANQGNSLENGTLVWSCDETVFPVLSLPAGAQQVPGGYSFEIENLLPEENIVFEITLGHPGVAYMDSLFASTVDYVSQDLSEVHTIYSIIACAYDPNMIVVSPAGMSEDGFVLPQQTMEYTIHFQNLGNAAANTVRIENTFSEWLDYSQLEILASSHPMAYHYNQGHARFDFAAIGLAPASANEEASKGYVTYRISLRADAPYFTAITNMALIYFDLNPAIVTNEASNQVFDCNTMRGWSLDETSYCQHDTIEVESIGSYVSSYQWWYNDQLVNQTAAFNQTLETAGQSELMLRCSNALCMVSEGQTFEVLALPEPVIRLEENTLVTDAYSSIAWELNGETISGANDTSLAFQTNGSYTIMVEDQFGCKNRSTPWIDNQKELGFWPNPNSNQSIQVLIEGTAGTLRLLDESGRLVRLEQIGHRNTIDLTGLGSGIYLLLVTDELRSYAPARLVVQ